MRSLQRFRLWRVGAVALVLLVCIGLTSLESQSAAARRRVVTPHATALPFAANITWSASKDLSSSDSQVNPSVDSLKPNIALGAESSNQSVHVVWLNGQSGVAGYKTEYINSTNNGTSFSNAAALSVNGSSCSSTLGDIVNAVDSRGRVHVVWSERPNVSCTGRTINVYYRRREADGSWTPSLGSPAIQIASLIAKTGDAYSANPGIDLSLSTADILHVVWVGAANANNSVSQNWAVYYANSVDGGSTWNNFDHATPIQNGQGYYIEPYVIGAPDGSAHIIWHGGNGYPKNVQANHYLNVSSTSGKGTWSGVETIDTYGQRPSLALDPTNGDLYGIYQGLDSVNNTGNANVRTLRFIKWNGSSAKSWTAPKIIVDNPTVNPLPKFLAEVPSLVIDDSQVMYLTYDLTTDSVTDNEGVWDTVSHDLGGSWTTPESIELNQRVTAPRLKYGQGKLHLVYAIRPNSNSNPNQVYYRNANVPQKALLPNGTPTIVAGSSRSNSAVVTFDLSNFNSVVSEIDVSNSNSFAAGTYQSFTIPASGLATVGWNMANPTYGGSWASGSRTIYVRYLDSNGHTKVVSVAVTLSTLSMKPVYHAFGDSAAASEKVAVFNPQQFPAAVVATYYAPGVATRRDSLILAPGATTTFDAKAAVPGAVGVTVESDSSVYSQMTSTNAAGGLDGAIGQFGVAKTWYFAGNDIANAKTFVDLLNPDPQNAATVHVTYFHDDGTSTATDETVPVASQLRLDIASKSGTSNPISVQASVTGTTVAGIAAARRIVANDNSWFALSGGVAATSSVAGLATAAPAWYVAPGTTVGGADETITIFNPNAAALTVNVRYDGDNIAPTAPATLPSIPANARVSFKLSSVLSAPGLAGIKLSAGAPFVAERTLTSTAGAAYSVAPATPALYDFWYTPYIATGGSTQAHICVYNPNSTSVYVTFKFRNSDGTLPSGYLQLINVPSQRVYCANITSSDQTFGGLFGKTLSATIQTADERTPQMSPAISPTHYPIAVEYGYGPASGDAAFLPAMPAPNMTDTEK